MTTIHTRQLQQYTQPTNNNYTQDNLKLATLYTRQIRILQHVQKAKPPSKRVLCTVTARRRDLPDNTQHSLQTNNHTPGGIRTHNPSRRAAVDVRLRPRDHWVRPYCT